jgi:hypothetical protein
MPPATAAPAPAGQGGGNLLTQKLGPLATWVWLLIATVAVGAIYLIMKYRQSQSTAASSTATGSTTGVGQVPDYIVQNYLGNTPSGAAATTPPPATTTTTTPPPVSVPPNQPPPTKAPAPAAASVTVPDVTGQRANFAIGELESLGLAWHSTTGDRNPKDTYVVSGQNPAANTKVPRGTSVALAYRQT